MALPKPVAIILFLFALKGSFLAQKTEKELLKKTWYSNSNIGSDSLVLSADNTNKPSYEIKFSPTGKLVLKQLKKRNIDSACTYIIKKRRLTINLNLKDSVETFEYTIKKIPVKKAYQLSMEFSSRYIKRKRDDTITLDKLTLLQGKKRKTIEYQQGVTVFYQKKALHNDSIDLAVWGQFIGFISDTLLIDADQYVEHNFYKKYTDTLHYIAPLLLDTVIRIKVPLKEITGIYTQRGPFTSYTTDATILAMCVGFVGVGASVIAQEHPIGSAFAQTGIISLLTIPLSYTAGMIFSTQKFLINAGAKNKKTWQVERHMPNIIVTQRNQKKIKAGKKIRSGT